MRGTLSALFALLLGTSLFVSGSGLLTTALSLRANELGFSGSTMGAIMSAYFLGFVVATYWCPRIVERAGHVRAFSAFAATGAAAVLLHTLTTSAASWMVLRFVTGATVVGLYMVIESWLNERSSNDNRGRVFAVYQVISLLALGAGQYLLLLPTAEPLAPFIVAGALFSIGLVPVVLTRVEHPRPISAVRLDLRKLWGISPLSVAGTFLVALGNSALMTIGPAFGQRLGFDTLDVVLFMSLVFAGGVALQWPIGHLSDRWDRRTVILLVSLGGAALAILAWLFVDVMLAVFLFAMCGYGGAAFTLYPLCIANANDHSESQSFVATASGLLLIYGIGAAIGPLVAGGLLEALGPASLPLFLAAMHLALAAFVAARKTVKASPPAAAQESFVMLARTSQSALEMIAADASPATAIVSQSAPYPDFGEIERLDPALDALIPPGAGLELLAEGFAWAEGPVWIADGDCLLFSDVPRNCLYRWSETDGVALFMRPSGYDGERTDIPEPGSNGLALGPDGRLLLAEHGNRRIARLDEFGAPTGGKTTIADRYDGKRFNSPNDLVVAANGDIYLTDPPYGLAGQVDDPDKELDFQGVYLIRMPAGEVVLLATQSRPNGIGLSPDGRTLYVSNSDPAAPRIYAYERLTDGGVGERRTLFDAGALATGGRRGMPDGMAIDASGRLWATGPGGVMIIDPSGRHLGTVLTDQPAANCAFNADGTALYITTGSRLARLRLTLR
jgi:sugar lactone lactonase YvrE/predicted MFS family arabinose efflux permease